MLKHIGVPLMITYLSRDAAMAEALSNTSQDDPNLCEFPNNVNILIPQSVDKCVNHIRKPTPVHKISQYCQTTVLSNGLNDSHLEQG